MNENQYRNRMASAEKAHGIYRCLKQLYPHAKADTEMFIKARVDKIITDDERQLLRQFYGRKGNRNEV